MALCCKHASLLNQRIFSPSFNGRSLIYRTQTTKSVPKSEVVESDYTDYPEYPPLTDTSPAGSQRTSRQKWYDAVKNAPTVEEKYVIMVPRVTDKNPARPVVHNLNLNVLHKHYNVLPGVKFVTRTHLVRKLPDYYKEKVDPQLVDAVVAYITPAVQSAIKTIFKDYTFKPVETFTPVEGEEDCDKRKIKKRGQMFIDNLHTILSSLLAQEFKHLETCQIDYDPRVDTFWYAGGFPATQRLKVFRRAMFLAVDEDDPMHYLFQYTGKPYMNIRNEDPLPQFVDNSDPICKADESNLKTEGNPSSQAFYHTFRYPTMVPGVFHDEPNGFGTLTYLTRENLVKNQKLYGEESVQLTLDSMAVAAGFGWLNGLAFNKGFSSYQDITYPLSTQVVITDGRLWTFYAYQLNTISFNSDFINNEFRNVCWGTKEAKLFESANEQEVVGFNPEVLANLVRFYLNSPKLREGVNMTPYLQETERVGEHWDKVRMNYKYRNAERPYPTQYVQRTWFEKIYKHWFNTRLDKLR